MSIWFKTWDCNQINKEFAHGILEQFNIKFVEVGEDYMIATMPASSDTHQPYGVLHGGISCVLSETLASIAGSCVIDLTKYRCVGLEINGNHLKQVHGGLVKAIAKPCHLGNKTQVWGVEMYDDKQRLCFISRVTLFILNIKKTA